MISIVVPCYNVERFIGNIVKDVNAQTFTDWELIFVSNGKNQERQIALLEQVVNDNSKIRFVHTEVGGVSNARNIGIKLALGEWICFVDADR